VIFKAGGVDSAKYTYRTDVQTFYLLP